MSRISAFSAIRRATLLTSPQLFGQSLRSTLAIPVPNTPHRLGLPRRPWDFLRVGLPPQPAKSRPTAVSIKFDPYAIIEG
jgi:hypothetical protein